MQVGIVVQIVQSLGKPILETPVIHRAIENWLDRNVVTWLDALLWHGIIEGLVGVKSPMEQEAVVRDVAGKAQATYDEVKASAGSGATMSGKKIAEVAERHGLPPGPFVVAGVD